MLPRPPTEHIPPHIRGSSQNSNIGALAAHALTSALTNPYRPDPYSNTNANYHAYFTRMHPQTTPQGYTLSSTYIAPAVSHESQPQSTPWHQPQRGCLPNYRKSNHVPRRFSDHSFSTPGNSSCTYNGCSFTGTKKTVEIHMMDRHLIFPPGWKKRKPDWDADPSLKGKPVPIPGTGVTLNTPEAIEAWIAERRKKWPTNQRIEVKKRKMQEAADRGEIEPRELTIRDHKRRRVDFESPKISYGRKGRGRLRGVRRSDYRGRKTDSGYQRGGRGTGVHTGVAAACTNDHGGNGHPSSSASDEELSESTSDVDPVKDAVSSKVPIAEPDSKLFTRDLNDTHRHITGDTLDIDDSTHAASSHKLPDQKGWPLRRKPVQPKSARPNPFATRPSLLRSLLLPEIRHTVSNLSQAIHFLVENNFLQGVELKPGDIDSRCIEVLGSSEAEPSGEVVIQD